MDSIESIFEQEQSWEEYLSKLLNALIPTFPSSWTLPDRFHPADTLQGELVQCAKSLLEGVRKDDLWCRGHERPVRILQIFLRDRKTFAEEELMRIKASLDHIFYLVTVDPDQTASTDVAFIAAQVVQWCKAHTKLIRKKQEESWRDFVLMRENDQLPDPQDILADREEEIRLKGPYEKPFSIIFLQDRGQTEANASFIGGKPRIPRDASIPRCTLCNHEMVFYFQIAFPKENTWAGHTIAMFSCVSCVEENHLIPELFMGPTGLKGAVINQENLSTYQKNFRMLVFPNGEGTIRSDYEEKTAFQTIEFKPCEPSDKGHKIGGYPNWSMGDERPSSIAGKQPIFLFQFAIDFEFPIVATAPLQKEVDFGFTFSLPRKDATNYSLGMPCSFLELKHQLLMKSILLCIVIRNVKGVETGIRLERSDRWQPEEPTD